MMQLAEAASVVPQGLVLVGSAKALAFVPVIVMAMPVSDAVPVLVSVMFCAAVVVPFVTDVKLSTLPESVAIGATGATAVPVSEATCGELVALSTTLTVPSRVPVPVGVKFTEKLQLAFIASVTGKVPQVLVCEKSAALLPDTRMLVIEIAALLPFVSVSVCTPALEPTLVLANVSELTLKLTVPVPEPAEGVPPPPQPETKPREKAAKANTAIRRIMRLIL
jgi:hypothetical protein